MLSPPQPPHPPRNHPKNKLWQFWSDSDETWWGPPQPPFHPHSVVDPSAFHILLNTSYSTWLTPIQKSISRLFYLLKLKRSGIWLYLLHTRRTVGIGTMYKCQMSSTKSTCWLDSVLSLINPLRLPQMESILFSLLDLSCFYSPTFSSIKQGTRGIKKTNKHWNTWKTKLQRIARKIAKNHSFLVRKYKLKKYEFTLVKEELCCEKCQVTSKSWLWGSCGFFSKQ